MVEDLNRRLEGKLGSSPLENELLMKTNDLNLNAQNNFNFNRKANSKNGILRLLFFQLKKHFVLYKFHSKFKIKKKIL